MHPHVLNWIRSAEYDLTTADYMFASRRYIYTVFMCHLALEKALKAAIEHRGGRTPPKVHDLDRLLSLSGLKPGSRQEVFVAGLSNLSIATRYPRDFDALRKSTTRQRARATLSKTGKLYQWILTSLES